YPTQSPIPQSVYPPTMHLQQAPPAYSELYRPGYVHQQAANMASLSGPYPGTSVYLPMTQSMPVATMPSSGTLAYYPIGPMYPSGSIVIVDGDFDAGARFGAGTSANLPPPPLGCPPNAAQLAAMQGANVLVTQRKGNYFMGGYSMW
ncbi:hypothetical protein FKM82_013314, partial [Ascaphus truei]